MNRDTNTYTILYASIMVIIVAIALSFTHETLSGKQQENEDVDKMRQILRSLNVESTANDAKATYNSLVKEAYLIDVKGDKIEGTDGVSPEDDAFKTDMILEMKKEESERMLPVFVAEIDGEKRYVMPMTGGGLWGKIWGYISVESDGRTIFGVDFSHEGETPGLGADIALPKFSSQFAGKSLFKADEFKSIAVVKPGKSDSTRDYVDGISGGTITCNGVNKMLLSVGQYQQFFLHLGKEAK